MQSLYQEGYTKTQIVEMLHTTYKRVRKYLNGNAENMCKHGGKNKHNRSRLDEYQDIIAQMLIEKKQYKEILYYLQEQGYHGKYSALCDYCHKFSESTGLSKETLKKKKRFISKQEIIRHIWSGKSIDEKDKEIIFGNYPELQDIEECVREFRTIYENKSTDLLYSFISKYIKSNINCLKSFANGLKLDLGAVESSVTSPYSNGILEGNNNRLKVIKRVMYGKAKLPLLRAKVLPSAIFYTSLYPNMRKNRILHRLSGG
jgi:predicted transcriptional regulator